MHFSIDAFTAGFQAIEPDAEVPELAHAGEAWAREQWHVMPHRHAVWELHLQRAGTTHWQSGKTLFDVGPDTLFVAPPGASHWTTRRSKEKLHFIWAGFDVRPVLARRPELAGAWTTRRCRTIAQCGDLRHAFEILIREVIRDRPLRTSGVRAALDYLVVESSRAMLPGRSDGTILPAHPAVRLARELLDEHCGQPWTLEKLGEVCGISPKHLSSLFTADVGMPPHQFLMSRRLDRAIQMLRTSDISVTDLAMDLGFSSSQHFSTMFRRRTGQTPRTFRARRTRAV